MQTAAARSFILNKLTLILLLASSVLYSQVDCVNCIDDSLVNRFAHAKDNNQKKHTLQAIVDYDLDHFNSAIANSAQGTRAYLQQLLELDTPKSIDRRDAYESYLQYIHFFEARQYAACLAAGKRTVSLFDRYHHPINGLLMQLRNIFNELGMQDEKLSYFTEKLNYYKQYGPYTNTAGCYYSFNGYYGSKAEWNLSISNSLRAAEVLKSFDYRSYLNVMSGVGGAYYEWGNIEKSLQYLDHFMRDAKQSKDTDRLSYAYRYYIKIYLERKDYKMALQFADSMLYYASEPAMYATAMVEKAMVMIATRQFTGVLPLLSRAKKTSDSLLLKVYTTRAFELDFAYYKYYLESGNLSLAEQYLTTAFQKSREVKNNQLQIKYLNELRVFYDHRRQYDKSAKFTGQLEYLRDYIDSSNSPYKVAAFETEKKELQQLDSLNTLRQERAVQTARIRKSKALLWASLIGLLVIGSSLFFVYRQYQVNQKTLATLRSTQTQLIAAGKMASLGELTAGIAHEIQNPLNFINNFSEVSKELLDEMVQEFEEGRVDAAKVIAGDVQQNLDIVVRHGKRADGIVKGMLLHSRGSTGIKEATDINALIDEFFRLAYHGLRAKDKSFNATMVTNYDSSLGRVDVLPQDIGRVILNLITNAFYAVTQKNKESIPGYEPTVTVATAKRENRIIITVTDNGDGIPESIKDKIFQPFFTTKPTGEGTGLGLSMSYSIVTEGHNGILSVETKPGVSTTFIIEIPA